jgi:two-component system response regulator HydG
MLYAAFARTWGTCAVPDKDVLIVDDEVDVCDVLGGWLADNGYAVDVAVTAAAARELLSEHQYGVVVVDWRLRDGDGVALANLAAEAGSHAFVMSGYLAHMLPGTVDPRRAIMKPVRPPDLLAIVRGCIGKASKATAR